MTANDFPAPVRASRLRLIGHGDQWGRPDGARIMVDRGCAHIGRFFFGSLSVAGARDPRNPGAPRNSFRVGDAGLSIMEYGG